MISRHTFLLSLTLCCLPSVVLAAKYKSVLIRDVPHVEQRSDFCGEACAEMVLRKLGKSLDQDFVFNQSGVSPLLGRGCHTNELKGALDRIGFLSGNTWYSVSAANADKELEAMFAAMHRDLLAGVPSIICQHYNDQPNTTEHFRLVLGYDAEKDEVIYHEPAVARAGYRRMKRDMFIKLWPLKYDTRKWTVIRFRMSPGQLTTARAQVGRTDADYAQHVMKLKKKLPKDTKFHIVLEKPFVVVGDESAARVKSRAAGTIRWAITRIKKLYFPKDPTHIIDIWLFKDKESYEKYTKEVFDDEPGTPFGYYTPYHRALIMNISTGGGTLVHEIVHPFMASNFVDCPSWFNEGLASLYEQCGHENGKIWGYTNWRLRGLQKAIEAEQVPPFENLCNTTTKQFYREDRGTNYSQARYLCYYLQEKGLLVKYYHEFRKNAQKDPSGYKTLVSVLGAEDMEEFQKKWQAYVMKLRF